MYYMEKEHHYIALMVEIVVIISLLYFKWLYQSSLAHYLVRSVGEH